MFVLFRVFFRFVFCIDFWSFFLLILGSFWEALGRLLGAQVGHFLHQFLVDFFDAFLIDFGVILGGFWVAFGSPNRSFFASIFG